LEAKQSLIKQLDKIVSKDCILATNTSSISITKIASISCNPQNIIGMHFMNPVPVMKLVEIITGLQTSQETLKRTLELSKDLDKITTTSRDIPGFIGN
jgi:3-hydroxybutyryl-CoA dehydrogenase